MAPKHLQKNAERQLTADKNNNVRLLPTILTETIFIGRARTSNFKVMYVSVVLCTCVRGVHKFCSPDFILTSFSNAFLNLDRVF